jgi:hypothetical protein
MAKIKNPPAGGAPSGDDDDDDGDISPKHRELIISTVNAAVSTHLGRKLTGAIAEAIGPALEPITAQLAELGKLKGGQQQGAAGGGAAAGAGGGGTTDPAVAAMQSELTKLQAQLKARDDEAAKSKIATAAAQRDGKLTELLTAGGVDKLRLRGAAAVVRDSLVQDKDGSWKYRAQRDGYHEDLEVGAGIKEFLETDEGKAYLPATAGANGGSGARPKGNQAGARQVNAKDPKAAKAERQGKALDTLMSMVQQSTDGDGVVQLGDD